MAIQAAVVVGVGEVPRPGAQLGRNKLALGLAALAACGGVLAVLAVSRLTGARLDDLTRDVVAVADTHLYAGMLSTMGIMLWSAASSLCLLAGAALLRRRGAGDAPFFLLAAGLLTAVLALDDAFLIHERVAPSWLHVPQTGVFLAYAGSMGGFFLFFLRRILATDFLLLAVALGFLGVSMGVDAVLSYSNLETFLEDSCKFAGIVFWLAYFACAALSLLRQEPDGTSCSS
jgi:hypothetical protein